MIAKIGEVYALYGFEAVETPFVEYTDALGKFLPDQDRPNEGVFSFKDDDEQWLSLRYDLTAPLARYVAENYDRLPKPYRSYRAGWVFRNEKPGPGRFRQFMQFDADTVGSASPAADAEICMMAADCLEALGDQARRLRHQGQQPQGARRGAWRRSGLAGAKNAGRTADGLARDRQARPARRRRRALACWGPAARTRAAISPRARGSTRQPSSRCSPSERRSAPVRFGMAPRAGVLRWRRALRERQELAAAAAGDRQFENEGLEELAQIEASFEAQATVPIGSASTPPSCAGSNITLAPSSRRS